MNAGISVRPIRGAGDRRRFIDLPWRLYAGDPHWIAPLKAEVAGLMDPARNPWFEHAEAAFFLARRGDRVVGRISAQVDALVEHHMGRGTGQWGFFEAEDVEVAAALLHQAEDWLRGRGMTRALGPFTLSVWDEPGLLIDGFDQPPTVMMGHHKPGYAAHIEASGYRGVKDLLCYELDITQKMPALVRRLVSSTARNPRVNVRKVDKSRFDAEAAIILGILNDAWSDNWGFIPLTDAEIAYAGKKLKPIVFEDLIRIAEYDSEPVAFMITLPDVNELTRDLDGRLFPFGWAKLLLRLRKPRTHTVRVPLMGVVKRLQSTPLAGQLAFTLIEDIRLATIADYGGRRAEIGWILEENEGMKAIADALQTRINKVYRIFAKAL
ncbi:MAG TPA: N-acetyltransferase [Sphingomonadaceae bacterium]|nr:N-acetyltransferase [Sphingomonadaceae bacterium]